ncbi:Splicing factor, arginine/serine-rich 15 [Bagarius yarrelli]|uniref:Splicing factor, arginine/serine-rich 15 n=1 Tax=Bagarius yarrelli TaxID=175774 RepID=A0A556TTU9_BAGYA|nr:Splicing factor, arginine/serine-rich 15 [Bagarius yarrelli]
MMSITKAGMKAIKLYKHVVQIIEKFIKKCNPQLKVPGLYVVDSIIRQSRHQFGEDKDVFGPRFLKNISATFQSLYECPPDDKLQQLLRTLQQGGAAQSNTASIASTANPAPVQQNSSISKVLQDRFDYDEEPDAEERPPVEAFPALSMLNQFSPEEMTVTGDQAGGPVQGKSPRRRLSPRSQSSHSRHSRHHRSRSRERWRSPPRSHTGDPREMERRRKGLPPMKRETLSVCSTTLWLGQLDKKTQQQDVNSLIEEFGQIDSINMIPPRGCAYIVMVHRQDAYTALNKLSRGNAKINNKSFKGTKVRRINNLEQLSQLQLLAYNRHLIGQMSLDIAWAINKGVSGRFKKYWNTELGVTYVPWEKLKDSELVALREGAILDQETLRPADPVPSLSEDLTGSLSNQSPLNHPLSAHPLPFIPRFPNVPHPPPAPAPPTISRTPMFRIRLPMPNPAADFPHPGAMQAEHWNGGRPFRVDWNNCGPPRGPPEWFGPEPPFRHGGWSRGGHWGHRPFRN